ncbi:hypothetical protein V5799_015430 [Amblyomma americanum]|uniref:Secreted protein n=1 Tax=Amblyomma americanum TaxID=6943 RepID=A0AAQ4F832_AMBAM
MKKSVNDLRTFFVLQLIAVLVAGTTAEGQRQETSSAAAGPGYDAAVSCEAASAPEPPFLSTGFVAIRPLGIHHCAAATSTSSHTERIKPGIECSLVSGRGGTMKKSVNDIRTFLVLQLIAVLVAGTTAEGQRQETSSAAAGPGYDAAVSCEAASALEPPFLSTGFVAIRPLGIHHCAAATSTSSHTERIKPGIECSLVSGRGGTMKKSVNDLRTFFVLQLIAVLVAGTTAEGQRQETSSAAAGPGYDAAVSCEDASAPEPPFLSTGFVAIRPLRIHHCAAATSTSSHSERIKPGIECSLVSGRGGTMKKSVNDLRTFFVLQLIAVLVAGTTAEGQRQETSSAAAGPGYNTAVSCEAASAPEPPFLSTGFLIAVLVAGTTAEGQRQETSSAAAGPEYDAAVSCEDASAPEPPFLSTGFVAIRPLRIHLCAAATSTSSPSERIKPGIECSLVSGRGGTMKKSVNDLRTFFVLQLIAVLVAGTTAEGQRQETSSAAAGPGYDTAVSCEAASAPEPPFLSTGFVAIRPLGIHHCAAATSTSSHSERIKPGIECSHVSGRGGTMKTSVNDLRTFFVLQLIAVLVAGTTAEGQRQETSSAAAGPGYDAAVSCEAASAPEPPFLSTGFVAIRPLGIHHCAAETSTSSHSERIKPGIECSLVSGRVGTMKKSVNDLRTFFVLQLIAVLVAGTTAEGQRQETSSAAAGPGYDTAVSCEAASAPEPPFLSTGFVAIRPLGIRHCAAETSTSSHSERIKPGIECSLVSGRGGTMKKSVNDLRTFFVLQLLAVLVAGTTAEGQRQETSSAAAGPGYDAAVSCEAASAPEPPFLSTGFVAIRPLGIHHCAAATSTSSHSERIKPGIECSLVSGRGGTMKKSVNDLRTFFVLQLTAVLVAGTTAEGQRQETSSAAAGPGYDAAVSCEAASAPEPPFLSTGFVAIRPLGIHHCAAATSTSSHTEGIKPGIECSLVSGRGGTMKKSVNDLRTFFVLQLIAVLVAGTTAEGQRQETSSAAAGPGYDAAVSCEAASAPEPPFLSTGFVAIRPLGIHHCAAATSTSSHTERIKPGIECSLVSGRGGTMKKSVNDLRTFLVLQLIAVLVAGTTAEGQRQETSSAAAGPGYDAAVSCEAASAPEPPFLSTGFVAIRPLGIHHCAAATSTSSHTERIKPGIECSLVSGRGGTMKKSVNDLRTFFVLQLIAVLVAGTTAEGQRQETSSAAAGPGYDAAVSCEDASAPEPPFLSTGFVAIRPLRIHHCAAATSTSSHSERIKPGIECSLVSGRGGTMKKSVNDLRTFFVLQLIAVLVAGTTAEGQRQETSSAAAGPGYNTAVSCEAASAPEPPFLSTGFVAIRPLGIHHCAAATSTSSHSERIKPGIECSHVSGRGGTMKKSVNDSRTFFVLQLIAVLVAGTTAEGQRQETSSAAAGPGYDAAVSCEAASAPEPPFLSTVFVAIRPLGIHHCAAATSTSSHLERINPGIEYSLVSGRGGTMKKSVNDLRTFFVLQLIAVLVAGTTAEGQRKETSSAAAGPGYNAAVSCEAASAPEPPFLSIFFVAIRPLGIHHCAAATSTSSQSERIKPGIEYSLLSGRGCTMKKSVNDLRTFFVLQLIAVLVAGTKAEGQRQETSSAAAGPGYDAAVSCEAASAPEPPFLSTVFVAIRPLGIHHCAAATSTSSHSERIKQGIECSLVSGRGGTMNKSVNDLRTFFVLQLIAVLVAGTTAEGQRQETSSVAAGPGYDAAVSCEAASAPEPPFLSTGFVAIRPLGIHHCAAATSMSSHSERIIPAIECSLFSGRGGAMNKSVNDLRTFFVLQLIVVLVAGTKAEGQRQETSSAAAGPGYDAAVSCEAASAPEPPFLSTGFVAIRPLGIHHCAAATSTSSHSERIKPGIECSLVSGRGGTMKKSVNDLRTFFVLQLIAVLVAGTTAEGQGQETSSAAAGPGYDAAVSCEAASAPEPPFLSTGFVAIRPLGIHHCAAATSTSSHSERIKPGIECSLVSGRGSTMKKSVNDLRTFFVLQLIAVLVAGTTAEGQRQETSSAAAGPGYDAAVSCEAASAPEPPFLSTGFVAIRPLGIHHCAAETSTSSHSERIKPGIECSLVSGRGSTMKKSVNDLATFFVLQLIAVLVAGTTAEGQRQETSSAAAGPGYDAAVSCEAGSAPEPPFLSTVFVAIRPLGIHHCAAATSTSSHSERINPGIEYSLLSGRGGTMKKSVNHLRTFFVLQLIAVLVAGTTAEGQRKETSSAAAGPGYNEAVSCEAASPPEPPFLSIFFVAIRPLGIHPCAAATSTSSQSERIKPGIEYSLVSGRGGTMKKSVNDLRTFFVLQLIAVLVAGTTAEGQRQETSSAAAGPGYDAAVSCEAASAPEPPFLSTGFVAIRPLGIHHCAAATSTSSHSERIKQGIECSLVSGRGGTMNKSVNDLRTFFVLQLIAVLVAGTTAEGQRQETSSAAAGPGYDAAVSCEAASAPEPPFLSTGFVAIRPLGIHHCAAATSTSSHSERIKPGIECSLVSGRGGTMKKSVNDLRTFFVLQLIAVLVAGTTAEGQRQETSSAAAGPGYDAAVSCEAASAPEPPFLSTGFVAIRPLGIHHCAAATSTSSHSERIKPGIECSLVSGRGGTMKKSVNDLRTFFVLQLIAVLVAGTTAEGQGQETSSAAAGPGYDAAVSCEAASAPEPPFLSTGFVAIRPLGIHHCAAATSTSSHSERIKPGIECSLVSGRGGTMKKSVNDLRTFFVLQLIAVLVAGTTAEGQRQETSSAAAGPGYDAAVSCEAASAPEPPFLSTGFVAIRPLGIHHCAAATSTSSHSERIKPGIECSLVSGRGGTMKKSVNDLRTFFVLQLIAVLVAGTTAEGQRQETSSAAAGPGYDAAVSCEAASAPEPPFLSTVFVAIRPLGIHHCAAATSTSSHSERINPGIEYSLLSGRGGTMKKSVNHLRTFFVLQLIAVLVAGTTAEGQRKETSSAAAGPGYNEAVSCEAASPPEPPFLSIFFVAIRPLGIHPCAAATSTSSQSERIKPGIEYSLVSGRGGTMKKSVNDLRTFFVLQLIAVLVAGTTAEGQRQETSSAAAGPGYDAAVSCEAASAPEPPFLSTGFVAIRPLGIHHCAAATSTSSHSERIKPGIECSLVSGRGGTMKKSVNDLRTFFVLQLIAVLVAGTTAEGQRQETSSAAAGPGYDAAVSCEAASAPEPPFLSTGFVAIRPVGIHHCAAATSTSSHSERIKPGIECSLVSGRGGTMKKSVNDLRTFFVLQLIAVLVAGTTAEGQRQETSSAAAGPGYDAAVSCEAASAPEPPFLSTGFVAIRPLGIHHCAAATSTSSHSERIKPGIECSLVSGRGGTMKKSVNDLRTFFVLQLIAVLVAGTTAEGQRQETSSAAAGPGYDAAVSCEAASAPEPPFLSTGFVAIRPLGIHHCAAETSTSSHSERIKPSIECSLVSGRGSTMKKSVNDLRTFFVLQLIAVLVAGTTAEGQRQETSSAAAGPGYDAAVSCEAASAPEPPFLSTGFVAIRPLGIHHCAAATSTSSHSERIKPGIECSLLIAVLVAGTTAEGQRQETSSAAAGPGYDAAVSCEAASAPEPPFLSTGFVAIRPLGIHHCAAATSTSSHSERIKPGIECSLVSGRGGTMKKSVNDLRTFFVLQLIAVLVAGTTAEGQRQETSSAAAGPGYDAAVSCEAASAPEPPFLSTVFVAIRPLGIHHCAAATSTSSHSERINPGIEYSLVSGRGGTMKKSVNDLRTFFVLQLIAVLVAGTTAEGQRKETSSAAAGPGYNAAVSCEAASAPEPPFLSTGFVAIRPLGIHHCAAATSTSSHSERIKPGIEYSLVSGRGGTMKKSVNDLRTFFVLQLIAVLVAGTTAEGQRQETSSAAAGPGYDAAVSCEAASAPEPPFLSTGFVAIRPLGIHHCAAATSTSSHSERIKRGIECSLVSGRGGTMKKSVNDLRTFFVLQLIAVLVAGTTAEGQRQETSSAAAGPGYDAAVSCEAASAPEPPFLSTGFVAIRPLGIHHCAAATSTSSHSERIKPGIECSLVSGRGGTMKKSVNDLRTFFVLQLIAVLVAGTTAEGQRQETSSAAAGPGYDAAVSCEAASAPEPPFLSTGFVAIRPLGIHHCAAETSTSSHSERIKPGIECSLVSGRGGTMKKSVNDLRTFFVLQLIAVLVAGTTAEGQRQETSSAAAGPGYDAAVSCEAASAPEPPFLSTGFVAIRPLGIHHCAAATSTSSHSERIKPGIECSLVSGRGGTMKKSVNDLRTFFVLQLIAVLVAGTTAEGQRQETSSAAAGPGYDTAVSCEAASAPEPPFLSTGFVAIRPLGIHHCAAATSTSSHSERIKPGIECSHVSGRGGTMKTSVNDLRTFFVLQLIAVLVAGTTAEGQGQETSSAAAGPGYDAAVSCEAASAPEPPFLSTGFVAIRPLGIHHCAAETSTSSHSERIKPGIECSLVSGRGGTMKKSVNDLRTFFVLQLIAVLVAGTTAEGQRQETSSAAAGPGYDTAVSCEAASAPEPPFLSTGFVAIRPLGIHHCAAATSTSSHSERIKPGIECSHVSGRGGTTKKSVNDLRTFFVLQLIAVLVAGTTAEGQRQETSSAAAGPGYDAAVSCEAASAPEPPFLSTGFVAIRPLGIHHCAAETSTSSHSERIKPGIECSLVSGRGGTMKKSVNDLRTFFVLQLIAVLVAGTTAEGQRQETSSAAAGPGYDAAVSCEAASAPEPPFLSTGFVAIRPLGIHHCAAATSTSSHSERIKPGIDCSLVSGRGGTMKKSVNDLRTFFVLQLTAVLVAGMTAEGQRQETSSAAAGPGYDAAVSCEAASAPEPPFLSTGFVAIRPLGIHHCAAATSTSSHTEGIKPGIECSLVSGRGGTMKKSVNDLRTFFVLQLIAVLVAGTTAEGQRQETSSAAAGPGYDAAVSCEAASAPEPPFLSTGFVAIRPLGIHHCAAATSTSSHTERIKPGIECSLVSGRGGTMKKSVNDLRTFLVLQLIAVLVAGTTAEGQRQETSSAAAGPGYDAAVSCEAASAPEPPFLSTGFVAIRPLGIHHCAAATSTSSHTERIKHGIECSLVSGRGGTMKKSVNDLRTFFVLQLIAVLVAGTTAEGQRKETSSAAAGPGYNAAVSCEAASAPEPPFLSTGFVAIRPLGIHHCAAATSTSSHTERIKRGIECSLVSGRGGTMKKSVNDLRTFVLQLIAVLVAGTTAEGQRQETSSAAAGPGYDAAVSCEAASAPEPPFLSTGFVAIRPLGIHHCAAATSKSSHSERIKPGIECSLVSGRGGTMKKSVNDLRTFFVLQLIAVLVAGTTAEGQRQETSSAAAGPGYDAAVSCEAASAPEPPFLSTGFVAIRPLGIHHCAAATSTSSHTERIKRGIECSLVSGRGGTMKKSVNDLRTFFVLQLIAVLVAGTTAEGQRQETSSAAAGPGYDAAVSCEAASPPEPPFLSTGFVAIRPLGIHHYAAETSTSSHWERIKPGIECSLVSGRGGTMKKSVNDLRTFFVLQLIAVLVAGTTAEGQRQETSSAAAGPGYDVAVSCEAASAPEPPFLSTGFVAIRPLGIHHCAAATSTSSHSERIKPGIECSLVSGRGGTMKKSVNDLRTFFVLQLIAVLVAGTTAEGQRQETSSAAAGPEYDAAVSCEDASAPEPPFLSTGFVAIRPLRIHLCAAATSTSSPSERIKPGIECSLVSGRGGTMKKSVNDLRTFFVLQLIAVLVAGTTAEGQRQ